MDDRWTVLSVNGGDWSSQSMTGWVGGLRPIPGKRVILRHRLLPPYTYTNGCDWVMKWTTTVDLDPAETLNESGLKHASRGAWSPWNSPINRTRVYELRLAEPAPVIGGGHLPSLPQICFFGYHKFWGSSGFFNFWTFIFLWFCLMVEKLRSFVDWTSVFLADLLVLMLIFIDLSTCYLEFRCWSAGLCCMNLVYWDDKFGSM